jgi:hypothetical protein
MRRPTVLILERDGSVLGRDRKLEEPQASSGYAELVLQPDGDLSLRIGGLLALAFDQLGLRRLELRVRDDETGG